MSNEPAKGWGSFVERGFALRAHDGAATSVAASGSTKLAAPMEWLVGL
jgi:hypothetical protein